jgi:hypothetical protein
VTVFERRIAIAGTLLAAVTAALFYVQLNEMTSQTLILSSQSQSAAASSLMDGMNTRKQLAIAAEQARAAQESVAAIQRQIRQDQRAWMQISAKIQPIVLNPNHRNLVIPLHIVNIGKTSAMDVLTEANLEVVPIKEKPDLSYDDRKHWHDFSGLVFQGESSSYDINAEKLAFGPSDYDLITSGRAYFVYFARVSYRDIFGVKHWTHFCGAHNLVGVRYTPRKCADYNRVDNN